MKIRPILYTLWLTAGMLAAAAAHGETAAPAVERLRDSADRSDITRWYKPGDAQKQPRKFTGCEGALEYDFEIARDGWYELWQKGHDPSWSRDLYLDGKMLERLLWTPKDDPHTAQWRKECNVYLTAGKHILRYVRQSFPGSFPSAWKLVPGGSNPWSCVRARLTADAVRTSDSLELRVQGGAPAPTAYELAARNLADGRIVPLGKFDFPATAKPLEKTVRFPAPPEGFWTLRLRNGSKISLQADLSAKVFVTIDTAAAPPGPELKRTLIADIDCVKTPPFREKDGKTRIVRAPFGSYRESSGNASNAHWALDGFSYAVTLPDIQHTYQLVVTYPDDTFRSVGFWTNDGERDGTDGMILTGGVETGGQYRNTNSMQTHEAFFYPRSVNLVIAALNLNNGSRAAAARIQVYRIDGKLPAAEPGTRRGRLAGFFFEEPSRWKRHFGLGSAPVSTPFNRMVENLRSMERWADWNRYCGQNLMSPSVIAYCNVSHPSRVMDGSHLATVSETRMLALVAEKYNNRYLPHITLHGDMVFDKRMGIGSRTVPGKNGKPQTVPTFADPDVIEWSKTGTTAIPWRSWSYNCLHPKVQKYMLDIIGEIADMLGDSKSFAGISIRIPLGWQFSGVTGLNNADYGYGDWTVREFEKETGIKVPGTPGDPKRFAARYQFLMSSAHRAEWFAWRHRRVRAYYRAIRDRVRRAKPDAQVIFMWWPADGTKDIAETRKACGIDPADFKNEDGIGLYNMGIFYGRRYFTPGGNAVYDAKIHTPDDYALSRTGMRPLSIYPAYYEVNSNLKWEELGGKKYHAFDALAPGGVHELQSYAMPLAAFDVGAFINGGNGWIFGTPRLTAPFMREFLALPPDEFEPVPGYGGGNAVVRQKRTGDGLFVYAVNRLDVPVEVAFSFKNAGEILSAAGMTETSPSFTLPPYGMRSLLVRDKLFSAISGKAEITGVKTSAPEAIRNHLAPRIAFAQRLRADLAAGRAAAGELDDAQMRAALAALDGAIGAFDRAEYGKADSLLRRWAVTDLFDRIGCWPENSFASREPIGGLPANTARMPELKPLKLIGGDPLEAPDSANYAIHDGKIYAAVASGIAPAGILEFRIFDGNGKYRKTMIPTLTGRRRTNARGEALPLPQYLSGGSPILFRDGALYVGRGREYAKFNPETMRSLPPEIGLDLKFAKTPVPPPQLRWKTPRTNLNTVTQLKVRDGRVWFLSGNEVRSLDPATDQVRTELKTPRSYLAFAFDPAGNLYLAEHYRGKRGVYVSVARRTGDGFAEPVPIHGKDPLAEGWFLFTSDLLVSPDGSLIFRTGYSDLTLDAWKDGTRRTWRKLGKSNPSQGAYTGMLQTADGTFFLAGGGSRKVICLNPDGSVRWERKHHYSQTKLRNSLELRAPTALALDGKGRLWVGDTGLRKLICLDAKDGSYLGSFGHGGSIDDPDGFGEISGVAVVGDALYVADPVNHRIAKFRIQ